MTDAKNNEMISNDTHEECPYNIYKIVYKNNDFDYVMAFNNGNAAYQQFKKLVTFVGAKPNNHMFEEYKKELKISLRLSRPNTNFIYLIKKYCGCTYSCG